MAEFEVPQSYETTIVMRPTGDEPDRECLFLCLPARSVHPNYSDLLEDPVELLFGVGFESAGNLRIGQLVDAIFANLLEPERDIDAAFDRVLSPDWLAGQREADIDTSTFAEYLAFAEVVPFEQSKVSGQSLVALATKSYGLAATALGTAAKAAPVFGPHAPVVFVVGAGAAGAVGVVNSIGLVVCVAQSEGTRELIGTVRSGIAKLMRRRPTVENPGEDAPPPPEPAPDEPTLSNAEKSKKASDDAQILQQASMPPYVIRRRPTTPNSESPPGAPT